MLDKHYFYFVFIITVLNFRAQERACYVGSFEHVWLNLLALSGSWRWHGYPYALETAVLLETDHALFLSTSAILTGGSGETVQQLNSCCSFRDQSSALSTHTGQLTLACNFNSWGSKCAVLAFTSTRTQVHIRIRHRKMNHNKAERLNFSPVSSCFGLHLPCWLTIVPTSPCSAVNMCARLSWNVRPVLL